MMLKAFSVKGTIRSLAALLLALMLSSCSFNPTAVPGILCEVDTLPVTPVSSDPPAVVFEDPSTIKVMHGSGRASLNSGNFIKIEQSVALPSYANQATVFLNGWKLAYKSGDHHVAGLGTAIARIRVTPGKITWNALGILADKNQDDAYLWTYFFTIVAWNDAKLHAMVDHTDTEAFCKSQQPDGADNMFVALNETTTTALSCFPSFLQNPGFASGGSVAVMPRGFGFRWGTGDHHLLQLAYNLDSTEPFIQDQFYRKAYSTVKPLPGPPNGRVGSGFVSWNSHAIMKDNAGRRDYYFSELVSGMGGSDVSVIEPPFCILPAEDAGFGTSAVGTAGVISEERVINDIPHAYAIPMLTGWDINYLVDDEHVREIGVWLDDFQWQLNDPQRTLRYKVSSVIRDKNDTPPNFFRHRVTILGLQPQAGVKLK